MKLSHHIVLLILLSFSNVQAQSVNPDYVDGAVYLKLNDTSSSQLTINPVEYVELVTIFTTYQVQSVASPFDGLTLALDKTYRIELLTPTDVDNFLSACSAVPYVDYVENVPLFYTSLVPNDFHINQWYLVKINAQLAWDISTGDAQTKIAIVDNAVSTIHEDLVDNMYINPGEIPGNGIDDDLNGYIDDVTGYDVANSDNNPNPPAGSTTSDPWIHGTHCAGIASATSNNGIGIASLGFNCSVIPVKCTPDSEAGNTLQYAYEGVSYAVLAGADVISMSWGSSNPLSSITGQNVVSAAYAQGVTLVGASGNSDTTQAHYPGAFTEVINVGSTTATDEKSWFSNYGPTVDLMAPGTEIYSTVSGGSGEYGTLSGTSMACPLVAGLCGLVISQDPTRTPAEVKSRLQNGCDNIDLQNPTYIGQMGAGRINASKTLQATAAIEDNAFINHATFANPFRNELVITSSHEYNEVKIYDLMGNLLFEASYGQTIRCAQEFPAGTYILMIQTHELSTPLSTRIVKII